MHAAGNHSRPLLKFFSQKILGTLGEKLLNVDAVDRRVPVFNHSATRVTWLFNTTSASRRLTIVDAKAVLAEWLEATGDDRHTELSDELDALDEHPEKTPVAFRNKKPATSLKFRPSCKPVGEKAIHYADYGRNPVLFLNGNIEPVLRLASEITGDPKIKR